MDHGGMVANDDGIVPLVGGSRLDSRRDPWPDRDDRHHPLQYNYYNYFHDSNLTTGHAKCQI